MVSMVLLCISMHFNVSLVEDFGCNLTCPLTQPLCFFLWQLPVWSFRTPERSSCTKSLAFLLEKVRGLLKKMLMDHIHVIWPVMMLPKTLVTKPLWQYIYKYSNLISYSYITCFFLQKNITYNIYHECIHTYIYIPVYNFSRDGKREIIHPLQLLTNQVSSTAGFLLVPSLCNRRWWPREWVEDAIWPKNTLEY